MNGVISIGPIAGITWRKRAVERLTYGVRPRIHREYGEIGSHELTTRTRIAMRRKSNVHATSNLNIPPRTRLHGERETEYLGAQEIQHADEENSADDHGGEGPQRSARRISSCTNNLRSIGSRIGSIFEREKRASAPKRFTFRVRTSQSTTQNTAKIPAMVRARDGLRPDLIE